MVSASEGIVYYCTVFLTALVFLTEASAITTHYEKSTTSQNKTNESPEVSPQRTKLTSTRGRGSLSKNQNQERVSPLILSKLKSSNKDDTASSQTKPDQELLLPSNSGGETDVKEKGVANVDDDDQKTLSQQVADGKYGLIQHEIFTAKPDRPGVLSYDVNPEVPKDNINNLGGLEPDDIWLAENHLLVLAGNNFNNGMQTKWRPIDNYHAPKRPVQLTHNPKIPPPFPVQLTENGPIEYLKPSSGPLPSFVPFFNPLQMKFPSFLNKTQTFPQPLYGKVPNYSQYGIVNVSQLKPQLPTQPPVLVKPPPGSDIIPPYLGSNHSEPIDEDDPSLYYPPPYDFYFPVDNTSKVPPGPLVPGIVLPPPPDFFSLMPNKTAKSKHILGPPKSTFPFKTGKQLHLSVDPPIRNPSTAKPNEQSTYASYDDIINEVTYPETKDEKIGYADVKENKVSTEDVDEWIPIPAPKPYYITGPKKPVKNTVLLMMEQPLPAPEYPKTAYAYGKPQNTLKLLPVDDSTVSPFYEKNTRRPKLKFSNHLERLRDEFVTTKARPSSASVANGKSVGAQYFTTTPLSTSQYNAPMQTGDTIKATYYFYEEPDFTKTDIANQGYPKQIFSTTSPIPSHLNDYPKGSVPPKTVTQEPSKRKPIMPMIPIYYLAELDNIVDLIKPMNLPYQSVKNTYYTTTSKPTYSISKPTYERPTSRPIFEYSYIASDYNGGSSSPVTPSTPHPYTDPHYSTHMDYTPYYPQQQYQSIYSPLDYSTPIQTTATPLLPVYLSEKPLFSPTNTRYQSTASHSQKTKDYDSFDRPWIPNFAYTPISYQTENPFYAFFTKEDEDLIDENTKKYFTIFGQKIRSAESTSPVPATQTISPTTAKSVKYYKQSARPAQTITPVYTEKPTKYGVNYYTSTVPYEAEHTTTRNYHKRPPPPTSTSQRPGEPEKPISLEGDTLVNYVTPLPTDPDAEYITPKISKYIRPIVVEDLPPDVNERLKNLMRQDRRNKRKKIQSTDTRNKYRYVLVDNNNRNGIVRNDGEDSNSAEGEQSYSTVHTPISLEGDILVNYQTPSKSKNHNAELVDTSSLNALSREKDDDRYGTGSQGEESQSSKPISLENDILVNYKNKNRLSTNPDAEYIDTNYRSSKTTLYSSRTPSSTYKLREKEDDEYAEGSDGSEESSQSAKPIALENDILVNYKNKNHLTTNPDAEYIDTSNEKSNPSGRSSNVISYNYPGVEHGHFYFLTPQETHLVPIENGGRFNFNTDQESPNRYFRRVPREYDDSKNVTAEITA